MQDTEFENEILSDFYLNWMKDYELKQSQSSFSLSSVESFTLGPLTSRYWMLRKHILHMDAQKLCLEPVFFAWDCITLQIEGKWAVHLIVRSEKAMKMLLKLLIHSLGTIDG